MTSDHPRADPRRPKEAAGSLPLKKQPKPAAQPSEVKPRATPVLRETHEVD